MSEATTKEKIDKSTLNRILLAAPYVAWSIAFIILPLVIVLYYGVTLEDGRISFDNIKSIKEATNIKPLILSVQLALISTFFCLLIAYPLALALRSLKFKNKEFIVMLFMLPMWMNSLLRTIAWQNILEKNGIVNQILGLLHLPKLSIINTPTAVVLGMVYDFLPFMIIPIYNVLSKIGDDVVQAAEDLGANDFQVLIHIIFPLSIPGVISGLTMVFVPALTTFVISDILGGNKVLLIGKVIEQKFKMEDNKNAGCGLSLVLMAFIFICMALVNATDKDSEGTNVW